MPVSIARTPLAYVALTALASGALLLAASTPAMAVAPGAGAVLFNGDGTPIGSELVYGAGNTPQYQYTYLTDDDDFWGLDSGLEPANDYGDLNPVAGGIPLGFSVNVDGVVYDETFVGSNGNLCLTSSTDVTAQQSSLVCTNMYYEAIGAMGDPDWDGSGDSYAAFFPLGNDFNALDSDTPVDTADPDALPDTCTFGAFLFEDGGSYYCSSVFWGTTTYDGKAAFVATWYHDPDYDAPNATGFSTTQVLLVNDGGGNATVVYNYDEVNHIGYDLNSLSTDGNGIACQAQYTGGDTEGYLNVGLAAVNGPAVTGTTLSLFGPVCDGGVTPHTAAELSEGGSFTLATHSLNSAVLGRYVFRVVSGLPTLALAGAGSGQGLAATGDESGLLAGGALLSMMLGVTMLAVVRRRPVLRTA